jgi:hypothetical protein
VLIPNFQVQLGAKLEHTGQKMSRKTDFPLWVWIFFCSKTICVQKIVEMGSFIIKIIISTYKTSFRKFGKKKKGNFLP